ncbi:hypothetical protein D3C76_1831580 [compost metagenome]
MGAACSALHFRGERLDEGLEVEADLHGERSARKRDLPANNGLLLHGHAVGDHVHQLSFQMAEA